MSDFANVKNQEKDAESASAPRRRGRPRKTQATQAVDKDAVQEAGKALSAADDSSPADSASAGETEKSAPKRRGRPRKKSLALDFGDARPQDASRRCGKENKEEEADEPAALKPPTVEAVQPEDPSAASSDKSSSPASLEGRNAFSAGEVGDSADNGERDGFWRSEKESNSSQQNATQETFSRQERRTYRSGDRSDRQDRTNDRRIRRSRDGRLVREVTPSISKDELSALKVVDLRVKAKELDIDPLGLKKAELVDAVYDATIKAEGFTEVSGILDILADGYGFLRAAGYLPSENDAYVSASTIRRNGLRKGDFVKGQTRPARDNEKFAAIQKVITVNGIALEQMHNRPRFSDLTPVFPDERLTMEHGRNTITARVIDLCAPIGKGQRGLIVSPPKAGKTTVLKDIAAAITANNPDVLLMYLGIDERPEEATDMERSIKGEVVSSTFDMPCENHIAVAELVIERAKRMVEMGRDVVILLDSITRLARAYNLAQPASGRILSGGVDSTALYPPKRFLGAARNIENGGSLTILASALIDTGSKMDEVIFEEFKGTGNMELKLDRYLADRRIFPAIDPVSSGTRKEELLLDQQQMPLIWAVRRILANLNNTERAMDMLIKSLKQTQTNQEFLIRTAKKAQTSHGKADDNFEL